MESGVRILLDVNGAQLVGTRRGASAPTVVFLHEGVCDRRSWEDVVAHLPDLGTTVAYDRRG
ncbi:MAG TPA: hypothetical protein VMV23_13080 [Candidatus Nanopelagicaceae bacterium]|nr:hypothetical protein [Candidatus Nanopelagicaceae bacterium]